MRHLSCCRTSWQGANFHCDNEADVSSVSYSSESEQRDYGYAINRELLVWTYEQINFNVDDFHSHAMLVEQYSERMAWKFQASKGLEPWPDSQRSGFESRSGLNFQAFLSLLLKYRGGSRGGSDGSVEPP